LTIASRFGIPAADIINLNNIQNQDLISPGDSLMIPGLPGVTGTLTTVTVQLGESLDSIAETYHANPDFLIKINRITSPTEVYAGASLIIPVVDKNALNSPYLGFHPGETLLEKSVLSGENPWSLLLSNHLTTEATLITGSILYRQLSPDQKAINPFDTSLENINLSPLPLVQGETIEIRVSTNSPVQLQGSLAGHPLAFFSNEEGTYIALQGIHAMAQPGIVTFTLNGKHDDGSEFSVSQPVLLVSGNYPKDTPLTVDPATIDPAVTQPEETFVENLVSNITPIRYWQGMFTRPGVFDEYTSRFGVRRSYNNSDYTYFHTGLDFAGGMGLPISAPADGVVVFAGPLSVRGNATFIDHGWGVYSGFFHQSEIKVNVGDRVTKGQVIGLVGNTGRVNNANEYPGAGAHLHWEVWVNGVQVNPMTWLYQQFP
jgi:murein DD-endopeptidase MepM/ murein hydrolase activator NlpD